MSKCSWYFHTLPTCELHWSCSVFLIYLPPTHTHTHTPTQAHICWKVEVRYVHSALGHSSHTTYVMSASSPGSTGPEVSLSKEEEVDLALQKNESGVESALLYAKTLSKYIKDLLGCMEKRLAMGETCIILLLMNINNRCNRKTKLWFLVLKCLSGRNFLALLIFCQIWRNIINVCCLVHLLQPFIVSSSSFLSDIEYAKSYAKMAESATTLASQQVTNLRLYLRHWSLAELVSQIVIKQRESKTHKNVAFSMFPTGLHASKWHLRFHIQERDWIQPAAHSDFIGSPKQ